MGVICQSCEIRVWSQRLFQVKGGGTKLSEISPDIFTQSKTWFRFPMNMPL